MGAEMGCKRRTSRPFLIALAAALATCGCGDKKLPFEPVVGPTPNPSATFTRVQNEVFTPSCAIAGCHASLGAQQGMSLAAGSAYGNTVRVRSVEQPALYRVDPGSPNTSYLVKKLRGDPDITGLQMPAGGTLTPAQLQLVVDWVSRGAPSD